jgi:hypothetical protein
VTELLQCTLQRHALEGVLRTLILEPGMLRRTKVIAEGRQANDKLPNEGTFGVIRFAGLACFNRVLVSTVHKSRSCKVQGRLQQRQ